jgi:hypothetical protein
MAVTKTGSASWGVTGSVQGVTGIVTDLEVTEEVQMAPEYNEVGAICRQTVYDVIKTARATIEVAAGTALPQKGKSIQIAGGTFILKSATLVESNNAYRKISVVGEASENVTTAQVVG